MDTDQFVNCRYCGTKFPFADPNCPKCGAPNEPEPVPWYASAINRVRASLKAKTESVWADRLASLLPLHFLAALISLVASIKAYPEAGTGALVCAISSIVCLLAVLVYYPGWYKQGPESRKDYGLVLFAVYLFYYITTYLQYFS